ncbi:MAG: ABC transporter permease [Acidimicrobiia bacterium]
MTALADRMSGTSRRTKILVIALVGVLLMAIAEVVAGTDQLTSRSTAGAAVRLGIPILLAGLGGLYSERSGVVNIGLEGMMIGGTWFAAWGAWTFGPWHGVILGIVGGAIFGLLHALATVTFNVDHIVSGVAINLLALGAMRFLSSIIYTADTGGSVIQSPPVQGIGNVSLPFLAGGTIFGWETPDILGWYEELEVFFISDVAGVLRGLTGSVNWLTIIAITLVPLSAWILWKTPWGLRLRSCGEDPWAAESLGVNVIMMKYWAVIISGGLSGLAGAFLVLVQGGIYREGMTGGRGFIGLGALIFGNWMPAGVFGGALVFGFGDSLRFRGPDVVRAFILAIALALFVAALYALATDRARRALTTGATGAAFLLFFLLVQEPPNQLLTATPYVITLLVLAAASQNLRMPAADGARYVKGEAH